MFGFKVFIFKAILEIKKKVMITEQIRTLEYIQEFLLMIFLKRRLRNDKRKIYT